MPNAEIMTDRENRVWAVRWLVNHFSRQPSPNSIPGRRIPPLERARRRRSNRNNAELFR
jgi:hypothetical protein